MARRSPGALRALSRSAGRNADRIRLIDGLSIGTNAAIVRLERRHPGTWSLKTALDGYRRAIRRSGRWLDLSPDYCSCPGCGDVVEHRDVLGDALRRLPARARRELQRVVDPLDQEFLRKTLPDPRAAELSSWHAQAWWRQRLRER
ncbi:hypothetical protein HNR22_002441 [Micromonospora jinlongensis]|uniref:Transposase n=1 Tax=Micromonospora jinlongensis TaxID=1287877 RepID=A0A7Y9X0S3_9ACTN|nr:hypothetical protein [Micromonospora jinlongensis]NYH42714.1 hypothetical protein [Micromonospora jinlongensis]